MNQTIRIGTRESQLALWQARQVADHLVRNGYEAELVPVKSEGDLDLKTPLYEMGVQGIFTRSLDAALLANKIDIAVHSMKDVPTRLPVGIAQAAVLERGPVNDLLVYKQDLNFLDNDAAAHIATSSMRRKAQWLNRYPQHQIHNLRGNVNTRLRKLQEQNWNGAIFAQAGLERIGLRPEKTIVLDWMLPAPAQGAIIVVCREGDDAVLTASGRMNDEKTALCTKLERDFLRRLMGGCSTPISALAQIKDDLVYFKGSLLSPDGRLKYESEKSASYDNALQLGINCAEEILSAGGDKLIKNLQNAGQ